ncbi:MAG: hypothetical protein Q9166_007562 [cf. Caloplaca sp. 2 TL-2023]
MTLSDEVESSRPITPPTSLQAPISPPRTRRQKGDIPQTNEEDGLAPCRKSAHSNLAAIEAGEVQIQDHLSYFSSHLAKSIQPSAPGPRLTINGFVDLYKRNCHQHGRHFVVHQHDHPVAGLHYDLRLQISATSSISFAIMYGLPGNPNSRRLNRNATETRVHNLWRKIRIRLHGTRLPPDYTLSIRLLTSNNRHEQPKKPVRKRRKIHPNIQTHQRPTTPQAPDPGVEPLKEEDAVSAQNDAEATAYERAQEQQEDEQVRLTNAYPGATNSINSIHQRKWYLSMDRYVSGFKPYGREDGTREWIRRTENRRLLGFEPFFVRGRDYERSVVTGRTADEVMLDEGVEVFAGRKGWKAVLE